MSDTPTETDLARDALQSEFNDLDVSGALVHAVEMFVEAKINHAIGEAIGGLVANAVRAERDLCAKVAMSFVRYGGNMEHGVTVNPFANAHDIASSIRNRTET